VIIFGYLDIKLQYSQWDLSMVLVLLNYILLKILLPSFRGEQGVTGITWLMEEVPYNNTCIIMQCLFGNEY
jgi:hypothetical protein